MVTFLPKVAVLDQLKNDAGLSGGRAAQDGDALAGRKVGREVLQDLSEQPLPADEGSRPGRRRPRDLKEERPQEGSQLRVADQVVDHGCR